MNVKYAYLIFHLPFPFPRIESLFSFDESTELKAGSLKDQVHGPETKHWGEWLGSTTWESLCGNNYILSTWMLTDKSDVLDGENESLKNKLLNIFRILPLVAPFAPGDDAFVISGAGALSEGKLVAKNIRSFSHVDCWRRSYYNEQHWNEFQKWAQSEVMSPKILDTWKACHSHYNKLFIQGKGNRQLFEGYRSFEEAMKASQLEFKMPNLVRALECVIVCWGFEEFAKKTLYLAGQPEAALPYSISMNTTELLRLFSFDGGMLGVR